jgi:hypothetical protein
MQLKYCFATSIMAQKQLKRKVKVKFEGCVVPASHSGLSVEDFMPLWSSSGKTDNQDEAPFSLARLTCFFHKWPAC